MTTVVHPIISTLNNDIVRNNKVDLGNDCILSLHSPYIDSKNNVWYDPTKHNNGSITGAIRPDNMKGLSFDGIDDYVDCGNNPVLLHRNDFTITAMVCPAFDIGNVGGSSGDRIGWYTNDRNLWCGFRSGKSYYLIRDAGGSYWNMYGTKTSWNINEWYMVTFSYSAGNGYNIYVNGNSDGSGSDFGILRSGAVSAAIGYFNKYYKGLIDEVRIYNRVLTATEIMTHFNATKVRYGL